MSNVTSINKNRARNATRISVGALAEELRNDLRKPEVLNARHDTDIQRVLDDLDGVSSEHLVKLLELSHKRERFEREMAAEQADLKAELEHAAFYALMAGAPEDSIAEIDDRTADALSNAMRTVQAQA